MMLTSFIMYIIVSKIVNTGMYCNILKCMLVVIVNGQYISIVVTYKCFHLSREIGRVNEVWIPIQIYSLR